MTSKDYTLSQTSLKMFEEGCHKKWKGMWIDKIIPFFSNEKMDRGKYFEYLSLGAGAIKEDEVMDLPRLRNGSKSKSHIRIEEQAEYFKEHLFKSNSENFLGYDIKEVQKVITHSSEKYKFRGVVDFEIQDRYSSESIFSDLKLTSDVNLSMHPKLWGVGDEYIDTTQSEFYGLIHYLNTGEVKNFSYLVFDYSVRKNRKEFKIKFTENSLLSITKRVDDFYDRLDLNLANNYWATIPNKHNCESCVLKCKDREYECIY